ncbi:hypothetical protein TNCV_3988711 [Trichonephila clavipes]|nr:hypothetical protein TNCV_3988711 [Trichonephila clavipes]
MSETKSVTKTARTADASFKGLRVMIQLLKTIGMAAFESPVRFAASEIEVRAKWKPTISPFSNGEVSVIFSMLLHSS